MLRYDNILGWIDDDADEDLVGEFEPTLPNPAAAAIPEPDEYQRAFLQAFDKGVRVLSLTGKAGAGKTWVLSLLAARTGNGHEYVMEPSGKMPKTLQQMADNITDENPNARLVVYVSSTHQARNVLLAELASRGVKGAIVKTVAGILQKKPDKSRFPKGSVLDTDFLQGTPTDFPDDMILVVDEASMVNDVDGKHLLRLNRNGVTIISGDRQQLPPIDGDPIWPHLDNLIVKGEAQHFELEGSHRAQTADLNAYINFIREHKCLPRGSFANVHLFDNREDYQADYIRTIDEVGVERAIMLAFRNTTVDSYGGHIRNALGFRPGRAEKGEFLRINAPFEFLDWHEVHRKLREDYYAEHGRGEIPKPDWDAIYAETSATVREGLLQIGDLLQVVYAYEPQPFSVPWIPNYKIPRQMVEVRILTGPFKGETHMIGLAELNCETGLKEILEATKDTINAINEGVRGDREKLMLQVTKANDMTGKELFGYLLGTCFYNTKAKLCLAQNSSSLTIHKAQGSGYDHVYVDWVDLFGKCTNELRYTSVSRARIELNIYIGGGA